MLLTPRTITVAATTTAAPAIREGGLSGGERRDGDERRIGRKSAASDQIGRDKRFRAGHSGRLSTVA